MAAAILFILAMVIEENSGKGGNSVKQPYPERRTCMHPYSPAGNRKNLDELFKFWRKHEIWYTGSFDQYKEI